MFKIPGIYIDIKGDVGQLKQDMTRARGLVREAAGDMSNSLNNALSPAQVQRGTNALIRNLGQLQRSAKLTGQSFDGLGVDLKEVSHLTGLTEK